MRNNVINSDIISGLHKKLEQSQEKNRTYKANIEKLLVQHKKLTSLTKDLIQALENKNSCAKKQPSIAKQIRLFKQNIKL